MSTYLQLAQKLRQECEIPGTGPSAVTSQTGQLKRLVDWIKDAYIDIQNRHPNWRWLRRPFTFNTAASDDTYEYGDVTDVDLGGAIVRFSRWCVEEVDNPPFCYLQSGGVAGEYRLIFMEWPLFRQLYKIGSQTDGTPIHITVDPQNRLLLGPKPSGIFVVTGEFRRSAQVLAADGDVPEMPADYHELPVYWGMLKYGANSIAQEIYTRAASEGARMMRALELNQLPPPGQAGPLA